MNKTRITHSRLHKTWNVFIIILLVLLSTKCIKEEGIESKGNIEGVITSNGRSLHDVSVTLGSRGVKISDINGYYNFSDIDAKKYEIKISKGGYTPIIENIEIKGGISTIKNYEIFKINQPVIRTSRILDVLQTSVKVNGNIYSLGVGYPGTTEHGHCWSTHPEPLISDLKNNLGVVNTIGNYESELTSLESNTIYYVRAYIKYGDYVFYGDEVEFKTKSYPPEIINFTPTFGPVGTTVQINGNNFSTETSENIVRFGENIAEIVSSSKNILLVKVPYITSSQELSLSIERENVKSVSDQKFDIWFPWSKKGNQNIKSYNAASFVVNEFAYVVGANSSNMLKYNSVDNSWQNNLPLPENSGTKPFAFQSGSRVFMLLATKFWEYNFISNTWTERKKYPGTLQTDRRYNFNFSLEENLYLGNCYKSYDFWKYNMQEDFWERKSDFIGNFNSSNPVWGNYTFSIQNKGFLGVSQSAFALNTLWEYKPDEDKWITRTPIPNNAYNLNAAFVINDDAYVGLGRNFDWSDGYVSNKFWKYNITNDTWSSLQNSPMNMSVYTSFTIKNKGYILPMYTKFDNRISDLWEFDPLRN